MSSLPVPLLSSIEESNPPKRLLLEQWIFTNIDHRPQQSMGLPICFKNNTSFYQTELPDFRPWLSYVKNEILAVIMDRDMKEDLEKAGLINWCHNVTELIPLNVPRDGNCLLHAVATAVWGIFDKNLILRRLLALALRTDAGQRFHGRWIRHQSLQISKFLHRLLESPSEFVKQEWAEICQCLEPEHLQSPAVPHRFLEAIHVYTLANILRRPIIVMTDLTVRTFSGMSLQENDIGGIYLPLEWDWGDTSRSPILLGYSHCHFTPLLFVNLQNMTGSTHRKNLAPLVNQRFEQLPIRFLLEGEEPEAGEILRKYLKITETVVQTNGQLQNVLCARVESQTLPSDLSLVKDYFQHCLRQFGEQANRVASMRSHHEPVQERLHQPAGPTVRSHPASPAVLREQLQQTHIAEYALGDPALQRNTASQIQIAAPSFTPNLSFMQQNASMNPPQHLKCVVPTCKFFGDPETAMMCSNCFKKYTIKDAREKVAHRAHTLAPSAPLASMPAEETQYQLSMMPDRCKEGCGYHCSRRTFPFCHECYNKHQAAAARTSAPLTSGSGLTPVQNLSTGMPQENANTLSHLNNLNRTSVKSNTGLVSPPFMHAAMPMAPQDPGVACASAANEEKKENPSSPQQILISINQTDPLTPEGHMSPKQLFGNGTMLAEPLQPIKVASASAAEPSPDLNTASAPTAPSIPGHSSQQPEPALFRNQQQEQQQPQAIHAQENEISTAAKLAENQLFATVTGSTEFETGASCSKPGCSEKAMHRGLCGMCYVSQGVSLPHAQSPIADRLKIATTNSAPPSFNLSSNPPAILAKSSFPPHQEMSRASSLNRLPQENYSQEYLQSWINRNRSHGFEIGQELSISSQPRNQPLGLPEKQETEPLKNDDLIQSGLECYSHTLRCIGCNAVVQSEGLCQQCKNILQEARHRQQHQNSGSVQESMPAQQPCQTEGCQFFGSPVHCGYCSSCYGKLFKRQLQEETRQSHPANARQTVPLVRSSSNLQRSISVPAQQGSPCKVRDCSLYGDPKMANMCMKHFQQHLLTSAESSSSSTPVTQQHGELNITLPANAQLRITPGSASICMPNQEGSFLISGVGYQGTENEMSVPPRPPQSSRLEQPSGVQDPSFNEMYHRVAVHADKCRNLRCNNFGNSSKLGLCNSCAGNQVLDDETIRRIVLGDTVVDR